MDRKVRNTFLKRTTKPKQKNEYGQSGTKFVPGFSSYNNYVVNYGSGNSSQEDELAPVMPAIDACQLIDDEANRSELVTDDSDISNSNNSNLLRNRISPSLPEPSRTPMINHSNPKVYKSREEIVPILNDNAQPSTSVDVSISSNKSDNQLDSKQEKSTSITVNEGNERNVIRTKENLVESLPKPGTSLHSRSDDYEFIPKSSILDVYSNDPEVKRFLKQLTKIANEYGYDDQDYKCQSCRRPIGLVFGQSRLCHFDGHHYCSECHLNELSVIPARILCNWDFNKYTISKRNQHFLSLISNEPMFELRNIAPLLYESCPELQDLDGLRRQAFFIRSYCFTCAQESVSFELTKQIWPKEHLIKQIDLYSLDDLIQTKNGSLKSVLKSVISFGKNHVLSCMLCCFKGFFCELCKSSQIIYPFDTDTVHRCEFCQSIYHKICFNQQQTIDDPCPRCRRMRNRQNKD